MVAGLDALTTLSIIYPANSLIIYYLVRQYRRKKSYFISRQQNLREAINALEYNLFKAKESRKSLEYRISRYTKLRQIIEEMNRLLSSKAVAEKLSSYAFELIAQRRGTCLLYLVEKGQQKPKLSIVKKEDSRLIIKHKEGDIFDHWVLRHNVGLFIEDTGKDFRFDLEKIDSMRPVSCLISCPLISQEVVLGILRLDYHRRGFYRQDDLRFLQVLSEIGAVALENAQLLEATEELVIKDALTGLFTKRYFWQRLKEEFRRCLRLKKELSLLMIDIDFFKEYNDRFGHIAGDIVLKEVASIIKACLPDGISCRFGGEEFCILLPRVTKEEAWKKAENLRQRVCDREFTLRRQEIPVTVSAGLASCSQGIFSEEELVEKADACLYRAKKEGRNRVCV
jgi:diguanylate cyclase (GGDEF)-like protein